MRSDYAKVLEFTRGTQQSITPLPTPMNDDETFFLIRMLLSEVQELALTMTSVKSVEESLEVLQKAMKSIDCSRWEHLDTDVKKCAAQVDSVVDMWYYSLNAFSKKCIDPSAVFDVVHQANMDKRDPVSGKFLIRAEDSKIIKPPNWSPPNIEAEIERQIESTRRQ